MMIPNRKQPLKQFRKYIGMNIYRYRCRRGLTQRDCALRAGICQIHWRHFEEGRGNMNLHQLLFIAQALGIQPQDLLAE